jgi:hypothetical protein
MVTRSVNSGCGGRFDIRDEDVAIRNHAAALLATIFAAVQSGAAAAGCSAAAAAVTPIPAIFATDPPAAAAAADKAAADAATWAVAAEAGNGSGGEELWAVYEGLLLPALRRALRSKGRGPLRQEGFKLIMVAARLFPGRHPDLNSALLHHDPEQEVWNLSHLVFSSLFSLNC